MQVLPKAVRDVPAVAVWDCPMMSTYPMRTHTTSCETPWCTQASCAGDIVCRRPAAAPSCRPLTVRNLLGFVYRLCQTQLRALAPWSREALLHRYSKIGARLLALL
jgi:hypothetical protein